MTRQATDPSASLYAPNKTHCMYGINVPVKKLYPNIRMKNQKKYISIKDYYCSLTKFARFVP